MLAASLDEHSDDDPEEPREFRHGRYINIVRLSNSIEDLMDRGEPCRPIDPRPHSSRPKNVKNRSNTIFADHSGSSAS